MIFFRVRIFILFTRMQWLIIRRLKQSLIKLSAQAPKYFNTLNFKRDALTFVPNRNGTATRCGEKGNWILPDIPALSSANLRKAYFNSEWIEIGKTIETPYYSVRF